MRIPHVWGPRPLAAKVLIALLPILWLAGLHVADGARVIAGLAALGIALALYRRRPLRSLSFARLDPWWCLSFLGLYLVLDGTVLLLRALYGEHGIDHLIFSQVAHSVSTGQGFAFSLGPSGWRSFLADHFSPVLAAAGALTLGGFDATTAVTILHLICLTATFGVIYGLARTLDIGPSLALFATCLFALNPAVRAQMFWGAQIEFWALPFLGVAYVCWLTEHHKAAALALVAACLCKESLLPVATAFATMVWLDASLRRKARCRKLWPYVVAGGLGVLGFGLYTFGHRLFFPASYDYMNRISTALPSLGTVGAKLYYCATLFLPFLFAPLWRRRGWLYLLPAAPAIGFSMLSTFPDMYAPYNHYAVLPTFIILVATLLAFAHRDHKEPPIARIPALGALLLVALALSFYDAKPTSLIKQAFLGPVLDGGALARIPAGARIAATEAATPFLMASYVPLRLYWVDQLGLAFDYAVVLTREEAEIGEHVRARARRCLEQPPWVIYCRTGKQLLKQQE